MTLNTSSASASIPDPRPELVARILGRELAGWPVNPLLHLSFAEKLQRANPLGFLVLVALLDKKELGSASLRWKHHNSQPKSDDPSPRWKITL